jgi:hypothetical protein
LSRDGLELNHWPAVTRDDDILAVERVDQLRETVIGVGDAVGAH